jgi:hypothetical protein
MVPRFFRRTDIHGAAGFARWASGKGGDVWHALASYTDATLKRDDKTGNEHYTGARTQANAQSLRCFWFDADIKRDGDGKDPSKVFADLPELVSWVASFRNSTGIPLPNLWVRSGYGMHLYWIVEDALDKATWQPHAEALKAALIGNGAKGDFAVVADAARILRPVDTFNYKIPAQPQPCYVFMEDKLCLPDYPNTVFLGTIPTVGQAASGGGGGGLHGPPPRRGATPVAAAARQGTGAQPRDFALIANECGQVSRSLNENGANDGRQMWHALVTLAWFCEAGRHWAHQVGDQHPQYTPAGTDHEFDQIDAEHRRKPFGPPLCRTLDAERGGVCALCPHQGAVTSPYQLGLLTNTDDLPTGYQRNNGWIEHQVRVKDDFEWRRLIVGDMTEPLLEQVGGHFRLRFVYTYGRFSGEIAIEEFDVIPEVTRFKTNMAMQGLTLNFDNTRGVGQMLMAWIEKLRGSSALHRSLPAFGWAKDGKDQILGFATGGTCYRSTGEVERARGDEEMILRYTPRGTLAGWQSAVEYVIKDQPLLQIVVAGAFAAPLIEFSNAYGICLSIWSMRSGTGKTSAFRLGASVWGNPRHNIFTLDDTPNSIMHNISEARMLPAYWDEGALVDDRKDAVKNFIFKLSHGRDKFRMSADIKVRAPGEWNTLLVISANRSIRSLLSQDVSTDATALRVMELQHTRAPMPYSPAAAGAIAKLDENYGLAGVEYARFIATHVDQVRSLITRSESALQAQTSASSEERFYVSGAACILAGAGIAKRLGLIDFDINAIFAELCTVITGSRVERMETDEAPIYDAEDRAAYIINEFCNHHRRERVVTRRFKPSGPIDKAEQLLAAPLELNPRLATPAYQIAIVEKRLRIDRRAFSDFCRHRNYHPYKVVNDARYYFIDRLVLLHGPVQGPIGAGTLYMTPRVNLLEVSLEHPKLKYLLAEFAAPAVGNNIIPLRPR